MSQSAVRGQNRVARILITSLILVVLLGGFWVRVWTLNDESIWHDEGWSIRAIRGPFTTPDDNTPYAYYVAGHVLWKLGTGETPFAFRYSSVLLGWLTVAVAIRLGWRWLGLGAGITTGILVASSPLLWEYSQEVRAYIAVPLLALLMLALTDALLHLDSTPTPPLQAWRGGRGVRFNLWLTLFFTELIGLYTHNLVVPLIVWLNIAVGTLWLWQRNWRNLILWGILHASIIALYIPWLLTQSPSGTPLNTVPQWNLDLFKHIWYSYFLPVQSQLRDTSNDPWLNLAGIFILTASLYLLIRQPSRRNWLLVSHALLVPILTTLLLRTAHIDFHPRYYIAAVPGTLLLAVAATQALLTSLIPARLAPNMIRRQTFAAHPSSPHVLSRHNTESSQRVWEGYNPKSSPHVWGELEGGFQTASLAIIALLSLIFSYTSLHAIHTTRTYQHDDFAALADYYATLPANALILIPFNREPALQDYYARHTPIRAQFINIPLYASESEAVAKLSTFNFPRPLEFLTWFQLPADVRGMYPCLLAANSSTLQSPRTFFGLSSQAFTLIAAPTFQPINSRPAYHAVTLENWGWMSAPAGICIRTTWTLQQKMDALGVAMRLLNPYGWILAQDDTVLRDREQVSTDALESGHQATSYHLLELPPAAPLTDYALELTLYSQRFPGGLDVLAETGAPVGKNFRTEPVVHAEGLPWHDPLTQSLLLNDNAADTIDSSAPLELTLLLVPGAQSVVLAGNGWSLNQPVPPTEKPQLNWQIFQLPPDADGEASLQVDETTIATYTVRHVERIFEPPPVNTPLETEFADAGRLVGVTMNQTTVSPAHPPEITLIWQAAGSTALPYTIFVQLLDSSGRVLAQSDSQPAANQRPTTAWVIDEYIVDNHRLTFGVNDYEGTAFLIVGLYDATSATFERVLTTTGQDHVRLPLEIKVRLD